MTVYLLCPKCHTPFAREKDAKGVLKTRDALKTVCAEKRQFFVPKRKVMCVHCGHAFEVDEARVVERCKH